MIVSPTQIVNSNYS